MKIWPGKLGIGTSSLKHTRYKLEKLKEMGRLGMQCAYGCNKRKKSKTSELRSNSEGTSDEVTAIKRQYNRTFHRYTCI